MSGGDLEARITAMVRTKLADPPGDLRLRRLSGGASQETWVIEAGEETFVLRRAPDAVPEVNPFAVGLPVEVGVIRAAAAHGVPAPDVLYALEPADGLGDGYVMRHIPGETLAPRLLRDAAYDAVRPTLARACGAAMARIHAVPVDALPPLRTYTPETRLQLLHDSYAAQPDRRPVFELAFQWLTANLPSDPGRAGLVHGDFRNGNLMIGPDGLRAVLDWELPHLGDGAEDLGWFCVPSWRFGRIRDEAGGFGPMSELIAGYESDSGQVVDRDRVRFWTVLGTLFWGISCVNFALQFRDGDRTVERAAIGRRASETELDLLTMLIPRS